MEGAVEPKRGGVSAGLGKSGWIWLFGLQDDTLEILRVS